MGPVLPHNFPAIAEALVLAVEALEALVLTDDAFTQNQHVTLKHLGVQSCMYSQGQKY